MTVMKNMPIIAAHVQPPELFRKVAIVGSEVLCYLEKVWEPWMHLFLFLCLTATQHIIQVGSTYKVMHLRSLESLNIKDIWEEWTVGIDFEGSEIEAPLKELEANKKNTPYRDPSTKRAENGCVSQSGHCFAS